MVFLTICEEKSYVIGNSHVKASGNHQGEHTGNKSYRRVVSYFTRFVPSYRIYRLYKSVNSARGMPSYHPPRDHLGSESVIHSDSAVRFVVFNVLEAENHARQKYEYTPRVGQPRYSSASWSKTSANLYGYSTSK
ncbi:hypothetical protein HZU73_09831 [Apis mellifera caucasica]|uniref:Uncharacterized protein LOC102655495 n=1 Tax=Apis mellifera TaxID=7460 RepID=A0A7M7GJE2_APIME|nr:uncharacterized protein LOC102655495 [Apis mellifera]KAG6794839.1 hypothetical protein HZU73_09831 [Apis mellifera caucasica]KAG9434188.1 hypothetical protein HZU67_04739 [Apis mellifera carnica]|eukprot:XP_006557952.1 uncharacterized protein LOC102655495 [Apis mellifera]